MSDNHTFTNSDLKADLEELKAIFKETTALSRTAIQNQADEITRLLEEIEVAWDLGYQNGISVSRDRLNVLRGALAKIESCADCEVPEDYDTWEAGVIEGRKEMAEIAQEALANEFKDGKQTWK